MIVTYQPRVATCRSLCGKGDHCLGACYRVGNIYVISTARDNTKIFAWSTHLFFFRESPLGEFFFEISWPRAARLRAWCCVFFIIYVQHLHNLREEEKLRNSGYMA